MHSAEAPGLGANSGMFSATTCSPHAFGENDAGRDDRAVIVAVGAIKLWFSFNVLIGNACVTVGNSTEALSASNSRLIAM